MQHVTAALAVLLAVTACTPVANRPAAKPDRNACGADTRQDLVGAPLPATVIANPEIRVLRPDSAMTMDFRGERLNVQVDAAGDVVRVFCG
ncbi:putative secreted protein [Oceaniovalibus guishaninsula JLT2003]|uniref:Putative secreted protein n=1 Tax=Oceaniovalibus guishaninsula JLT2003 TaxID=1231392 RepID=K2HBW9_9RHOB|nr:I78 family peptidase inhibitor [Oceaniovalibus guishaninsula]EKE44107.1 putative secreted protein [Oceaniovalibus guishaninsula JLT2003]